MVTHALLCQYRRGSGGRRGTGRGLFSPGGIHAEVEAFDRAGAEGEQVAGLGEDHCIHREIPSDPLDRQPGAPIHSLRRINGTAVVLP